MEMMYQYLWRTAALGKDFLLIDGRPLHVSSPGRQNFDAGPDFSNARITVDGTQWAGNVEIHVKASDWFRHGHQTDKAYDSIVLHVVGLNDAPCVCRADGSEVPTLLFAVPVEAAALYGELAAKDGRIRCASGIGSLPGIVREDWLETLAVERMQQKAARVLEENRNLSGDWEQTCFVVLARALGFGLNGIPFEMLARNLPLKVIHRHSDNPFQIEALVFGQAGMLDPSTRIFDEYYQQLCREYFFLLRKYGLRPMPQSLWKYARTRPQNFPHRRLAFLCKSLEGGFSMMRRILEASESVEGLARLFDWRLTGFWHEHFSFDAPAARTADTLGQASVNSLIINVASPLVYAYASQRGDMAMGQRAFEILEKLPPEGNTLVRGWQSVGLKAHNAMRSQALIHLHKSYCVEGRCLDCRFGNRLICLVAKEAMAEYRSSSESGEIWE